MSDTQSRIYGLPPLRLRWLSWNRVCVSPAQPDRTLVLRIEPPARLDLASFDP